MAGKRQILLRLIIILVSVCPSIIKAEVEGVVIKPIKNTTPRKWNTDLYIFGLGSTINNGSLFTSTSQLEPAGTSKGLYNTIMDFGLAANFYNNNLFRYNLGLGYMYSRYGINSGLRKGGLNSGWVTLDLSAGVQLGYGLFINGGLKGNLFLFGTKSPTGSYQYLGLNNDCYNKFSNLWYFGASYNFRFIRLEVKLGSYITPILNANKIAYHNLGSSHVEGFFYEFGVAFRIFTTTSKYRSLLDY